MNGVSRPGSVSALPDLMSSTSRFAAVAMSAPRSNARNRSSVLTLTSTPGISRLPLVTMSRCLAASSSSSPVPKDVAVSCAGDDTTEFCDGAYSAVAVHGSSLSPALSSLRRASSAQKPGSTALCHGSNRRTSEPSDDIAAWERGATSSTVCAWFKLDRGKSFFCEFR